LILVLDNYDSFTYNLVQYLGGLGADIEVRRNDAITVSEAIANSGKGKKYKKLLLSPGPGIPSEAGVMLPLINALAERVPIFGVCLGHQAIGEAFGGKVIRAPKPMHGKPQIIKHDDKGLFHGAQNPFIAGRYHSLILDRESLPKFFTISAETPDGIIMGIRHNQLPIEGVQFHPESVLTPDGMKLIENFVKL
jgi:anthranilate synthase component 2